MSIYADITDIDAISSLSPADIGLYLYKNGWNKVKQVAGNLIFDKKNEDGERVRIWLPIEYAI